MEGTCSTERNPKVVVLMSAYNGEKYIREQIDSILNQSYKNITLYVRDDGSTDQTVALLQDYEKEGKLQLLQGENLGYINSFFQVLRECEDADYYAWCDQDDVWVQDKIQRAVEKLEEKCRKAPGKQDVPVLYFSDYDYYDEKMNFQKHGLDHKRGPSFENSLMDCISLGFNSVFNYNARQMMLEKCPKYCCGHDWWTYMVCAAFGRVLYDRGYYSVKYRRLGQSISPGGKNFFALQIWRFKKFFVNDYFAKIRRQLEEFFDLYKQELKKKDYQILALFVGKRTVRKTVRKIFYPVRFRQGLVEEMMVRVLFILGKL